MKEIVDMFVRLGLPVPVVEFQFHHERDWRFDYAWPEHKIALECEGGVRSGGRHVQAEGFLGDMKKYNEAALLGWRVFRVTPKSIKSVGTVAMIKKAIG